MNLAHQCRALCLTAHLADIISSVRGQELDRTQDMALHERSRLLTVLRDECGDDFFVLLAYHIAQMPFAVD